jgi:hypothetical protein
MRTLEQILRDIRTEERNLQHTAARLARHRDELNQLKDHVNAAA